MILLTLLEEGRNSLYNHNSKGKSPRDLISSDKKNLDENRAFVYKLLHAGFHSFISGLFPKKNPNSRFPKDQIPHDSHNCKTKMLKGKTRHFHKIRNIEKKRI